MFQASSQVESVEWLARMLALQVPLVAITGDAGSGKSVIAAAAADHLAEGGYLVVRAAPPFAGPLDLLSLLAERLGSSVEPQTALAAVAVTLLDRLRTPGVAKGAVLLIDDAERLPPAMLNCLGEMHRLVNLGRPRLHIVLVGRLALWEQFDGPDLADLPAEITARYVVSPLPPHEALAYLRYRLHLAGASMPPKIPRRLAEDLVALGHGRPSRLNAVALAIAERKPIGAPVTARDIRVATARIAAAEWAAISFIAYRPGPLNVRHLALGGGMAALAMLGMVALPGTRQNPTPPGSASTSSYAAAVSSAPIPVSPRPKRFQSASSPMFAALAFATPVLSHRSTAGAEPAMQPGSTIATTTWLSNTQVAAAAAPQGTAIASGAASSMAVEAGQAGPSGSGAVPVLRTGR